MDGLKRIDHVGIVVDDLECVGRFLVETLGLELTRRSDDVATGARTEFYRCGDGSIELIELADPEARARRLGSDRARVEHVAIEVEDIGATGAGLADRGIRTTTREPRRTGPNRSLFTEPETTGGFVLQFLQRG
jgi:methylmalonyl-CoA/ethylmalonyl-CoA epimerase